VALFCLSGGQGDCIDSDQRRSFVAHLLSAKNGLRSVVPPVQMCSLDIDVHFPGRAAPAPADQCLRLSVLRCADALRRHVRRIFLGYPLVALDHTVFSGGRRGLSTHLRSKRCSPEDEVMIVSGRGKTFSSRTSMSCVRFWKNFSELQQRPCCCKPLSISSKPSQVWFLFPWACIHP